MFSLVVTGNGTPIVVVGCFHSKGTAECEASALRVRLAREELKPDDPFMPGMEVVVVPFEPAAPEPGSRFPGTDEFPKEGK